jgi:hypothetical protein
MLDKEHRGHQCHIEAVEKESDNNSVRKKHWF